MLCEGKFIKEDVDFDKVEKHCYYCGERLTNKDEQEDNIDYTVIPTITDEYNEEFVFMHEDCLEENIKMASMKYE